MIVRLALALWSAQVVSSELPPEAAVHNEQARALYDAGQLDAALFELTAAYAAMPDPVEDRTGRDLVLGSIRGILLERHASTGEAAPLCDLRARLTRHLAELTAAVPDAADADAIRGHLRAVEGRLSGDAACAPAAAVAPPVHEETVRPMAPARPAPPADDVSPRQLQIAGGVLIGLGGVLAGVMTYALVDQTRLDRGARDLDRRADGRPFMPGEHEFLLELRADGVMRRNLAIGSGVAAAAAVLFGAVLVSQGRVRARRVSVAPWWAPGGAGLTLLVRR